MELTGLRADCNCPSGADYYRGEIFNQDDARALRSNFQVKSVLTLLTICLIYIKINLSK